MACKNNASVKTECNARACSIEMEMKMNNKQQIGFTLIELVVVIVILGILAATALPKFVDLSGSATTATKAGVSGAVKSTLGILQAQNASLSLTFNPTVTPLAAGMTPQGTAIATGVTQSGY